MNIRVCLMVLFMLTLVACGTPVSKATPTTMPVPPTALTTPPVSVTTTPIPPPTGTLAPPSIPNPAYQDLVVGFSQIGAESDWRGANTESIRPVAK